ncbi:hypothetical protein ACHQM5_007508 [Ranunculus cassubicifolius]
MDHSKVIMAYILKEDLVLPSAAIQFQAKNLLDGTSNNNPVEMISIGLKPRDYQGMNANKDVSPTETELKEWFPEQGSKNRFWAACREPKKRSLSLAARYWAILELSGVSNIGEEQFEISRNFAILDRYFVFRIYCDIC